MCDAWVILQSNIKSAETRIDVVALLLRFLYEKQSNWRNHFPIVIRSLHDPPWPRIERNRQRFFNRIRRQQEKLEDGPLGQLKLRELELTKFCLDAFAETASKCTEEKNRLLKVRAFAEAVDGTLTADFDDIFRRYDKYRSGQKFSPLPFWAWQKPHECRYSCTSQPASTGFVCYILYDGCVRIWTLEPHGFELVFHSMPATNFKQNNFQVGLALPNRYADKQTGRAPLPHGELLTYGDFSLEIYLNTAGVNRFFNVKPVDHQKQLTLVQQCLNKALKHDLDFLIFPELSTTAEILDQCHSSFPRRRITVFGSYHHQAGTRRFNRAPIYSAARHLGDHQKIVPFDLKDEAGSKQEYREDIETGEPIRIYANDGLTFAVLICKDFLNPSIQLGLAEIGLRLLLVSSWSEKICGFTDAAGTLRNLAQTYVFIANYGSPDLYACGLHRGPLYEALDPTPRWVSSAADGDVIVFDAASCSLKVLTS